MLERWYLNRVQGMARMSTAVMALTPLAVLLINVNGSSHGPVERTRSN